MEDTVEVLVPAIDFVEHAEAVLVFVDVTVAVLVGVLRIDPEVKGERENDGDAEEVLDAPVERETVGDAVSVFDTGPLFVEVGLLVEVLDIVVVEVCVLLCRPVRVGRLVPVVVLDIMLLTVCNGEAVDVLDEVVVLVEVIDVVVVFVVVVDGETNFVANADLDSVVVFVEVLLCVEVDVNIAFAPINSLAFAGYWKSVKL